MHRSQTEKQRYRYGTIARRSSVDGTRSGSSVSEVAIATTEYHCNSTVLLYKYWLHWILTLVVLGARIDCQARSWHFRGQNRR